MKESAYYPPILYKKGQEVRHLTSCEFYVVSSVERIVGHMKYAYNRVHCKDFEGNPKSFKEWELAAVE